MKRPPMKNPMTAINEGNWRFERPEIACPEVQPPAYRAPKPTKNPPKISVMRLFRSVKAMLEKNIWGAKLFPASWIPMATN